ncbi:MAG: hypothetical protein JNK32_11165 [Anaerolineales bacterium]|nr:hypothetical protein [Anaerolineales bacterium]
MNLRFTLAVLLLLSLSLSACGQAPPTPTPPPDNATPLDVYEFAGHYEGSWTNSKTGATGPAVFDFIVNEENKTVTLVMDMGGNYLGLEDPPPHEITATYDDYFARIQGTDSHFGEMDVTVDGDGNIVGSFINVAGGLVPKVTYTGVVGNGHIDAKYTVTLLDGTVAEAVLVADRK